MSLAVVLVARPDELKDGRKFVAAITALAADLLSTDDLTAGGPKARLLGGVVLVAGGYAGVTDLGRVDSPFVTFGSVHKG